MENSLIIVLSAKRLREVRKHRNKKQWEIADLLNVKRPTYVGYEKKDEIEVTTTIAKTIAEFLKVEIKDLQSHEKVEEVRLLTGKHLLAEGENIILNRMAWDEFQKTLIKGREALTDVIKNNTDLTQNNSKLTESITDLVKNLLKSPSGNQ